MDTMIQAQHREAIRRARDAHERGDFAIRDMYVRALLKAGMPHVEIARRVRGMVVVKGGKS